MNIWMYLTLIGSFVIIIITLYNDVKETKEMELEEKAK
jgi:hypothetical protein